MQHGFAAAGAPAPTLASPQGVSDGAGLWVARAGTVFKSVTTTQNSNVAVWTPASGKRFRLLRLWFDVTGNAAVAAAGPVTISLLDSSTQMGIARSVFLPATAGTVGGNLATLSADLGPLGILSSAANNVLNVLLGSALTSGVVRVAVQGTEE